MESSNTPATPASTANHDASTVTAAVVQDLRARTDSPGKEALPDRPPRVGFQEGQPVAIRGIKDTIAERHQPERRDSCERFQWTFQQRRSNTGWSVASGLTAASTVTDITEPESPDPIDEGTFDLETALASSPPHFHISLSRSVAGSSLPTKPLASIDLDRSFSSRQRQRISDVLPPPRKVHPDRPSRRDSIFITHPLPITAHAGQTADDVRDEDSSSSRGMLGKKAGDKDENPYTTDVQQGEELSPGECRGFPLPLDGFHSSTDENTPDSLSEVEHGTAREVDDSLVQDFLDKALKHVFGVELCELSQGTASAAYQSVSYCLNELSYIVRSGSQHFGVAAATLPVNEAVRGHAGSGNTSIQAAVDTTGYGGISSVQGTRKNHSGTKKRLSGGFEGDEEEEDGDGDEGDDRQGGGKRQKVTGHGHGQNFSCPFRKRNPIRFNVRDFQSCAVQSFPDIPQLKRHIKNFHRQNSIPQFMCPRCREDLGSHMDLVTHSAVEVQYMCEVRDVPSSLDPEDGITPQVEEVLNGRKANSKVDCWNTLWVVLFGTEQGIPDHNFVSPTELDEVHAEFRKPVSCDDLRQRLATEFPLYDSELLLDLFNEHVDSVVDACRSRTSQISGRPRRTRNQGPRQPTASPQRARRPSYTASIHRIQSRDTLGSTGQSGGASSAHGTPINNDSSWPSPNQPLMSYAPSPGGYGQAASPGGLSDSNVTPLLTAQAMPRRQLGITVPAPTVRQPQRPVFATPLLGAPGGADPAGSHHMRIPSGDSGVSFDTAAAAGYLLRQQSGVNLVPNHFLTSTNLPVRQHFQHGLGRSGDFQGGGSMNSLSLDMNQVYQQQQQQQAYQHRMQHPQQLQMQGQGQSPISPHSAMTATASSPVGFYGSYEMGSGETNQGQYRHQH
ncbi:hypothetical protein QBC36DRAFT_177057 [Triangularia setosa]|uniref:C2H2-type domain-containing protein n=1 Tax=Triangularia setosa TaxID=2587417 RepID=A0AAN6WGB7_9PEZI|nr:hypothetical protein QBC36DRAFT_177057 [Podospora setosa]